MRFRAVFFIVVVALIISIAFFLLITHFTRGGGSADETPPDQVAGQESGETPQGSPVFIDGTEVYLRPVPDRMVVIVQEPQPQPTIEVVAPTLEPTATQEVIQQPVVQPTSPAVISGSGEPVVFIDYVVQPGDTLYSIADRQATSIELMAVHGISAEDLSPGTVLRLPVANSAYCGGGRTYVVRPGDNVFRIAMAYNTTTQAIAAANGLGPNFRIDVAQVLCIP